MIIMHITIKQPIVPIMPKNALNVSLMIDLFGLFAQTIAATIKQIIKIVIINII